MDSDRRKMLLGASSVTGALLAVSPLAAQSETTISADEVSFSQTGSGAVTRTIQEKARETVSIMTLARLWMG